MNVISKKPSLTALLAGTLLITAPFTVSAQSLESELDASIRLGLELDTEPDTIFGLQNYGSQIRYTGTAPISSSTNAIGYLELGWDQNAGINTTREGWIGVDGNFGEVTMGKQYLGIYDAVTSKTDIAQWGSCGFQLGCQRLSSVLKYSNQFDGGLGVVASAQLESNDAENSFFDVLDGNVTFKSGALELGLGAGFVAKEATAKSGFAFGVAGAFDLGSIKMSGDFQYMDKNLNGRVNAGDSKARIIVTLGGAFGNAYGLFSIANSDNTPFFLTAGYTFNISQNTYIYTEIQAAQPDTDTEDAELNARGVFVYNFDGIRAVSN